MKLKNITRSVREIRNASGWKSLVGPGEIIELEKPILSNSVMNSFIIVEGKETDINTNRKEGKIKIRK